MKSIKFFIAIISLFLLANAVTAQVSKPKVMNINDSYSTSYTADVTLTDSLETSTYYYYIDGSQEYKCDVTIKTDTVLGDGSMQWKLYSNTLESLTGATTLATVTTSGAVDTTFVIFSGTTDKYVNSDTVTVDLALRKRYLILQGKLTSNYDALIDFVNVDLTKYSE